MIGTFAACCAYGQNYADSAPPPKPGTLAHTGDEPTRATNARPPQNGAEGLPPLRTVRDYWKLYLQETFSPISAAGTIFNATFSQVTHSDPQYGSNGSAYGQRIGASAADIAAQNFFGDFLIASTLREDPRYVRRGNQYGFWDRFGYAISRAVIIRTDSGGSSFNWDNMLGSAMSTGFSNLYYPPPSRDKRGMLIHVGTDVADTGFVNLAPEFWPDFRRKVFGWYHPGKKTAATR
jgi:hypothetical protein